MDATRKFMAVMCVAAVLVVWLMSMIAQTKSVDMPRLAVTIPALEMDASRHAQDKHGWLESQLILDCLTKNGPYLKLVFKGTGSDKDKFLIPCALPDGRIGLAVFNSQGENITAYVPKDGTWAQVREFILQRATRFTGALKWLGK